jgi:hypothetical protein
VAGGERFDVLQAHLVASTHHDLLAQLTHVAREVVDERIAVIEQKDHRSHYRFRMTSR